MSNAAVTTSHESRIFYTIADDGVHLACSCGQLDVITGHATTLEQLHAAWSSHLFDQLEITLPHAMTRFTVVVSNAHTGVHTIVVWADDEEHAREAVAKMYPLADIGMAAIAPDEPGNTEGDQHG